jgi:hypothetical protein
MRWLTALRSLDRSGNANSLVMLLRGKIEMPRGFEMSPTARELLADLLERYHLKKKGRRTTLFAKSSPDRYESAAEIVKAMKVFQALGFLKKDMDRIEVMARTGQLDPGTLGRHIRNKVGWGRGKKRPSGKKPVAAK